MLLSPDLRGAWVHSNDYVTEDDEPVCVHLVYSTAAYARRHATRPSTRRTTPPDGSAGG
nr:hypothetical protein [Mycobacterium gastri]